MELTKKIQGSLEDMEDGDLIQIVDDTDRVANSVMAIWCIDMKSGIV
jgi:hypothetical protein